MYFEIYRISVHLNILKFAIFGEFFQIEICDLVVTNFERMESMTFRRFTLTRTVINVTTYYWIGLCKMWYNEWCINPNRLSHLMCAFLHKKKKHELINKIMNYLYLDNFFCASKIFWIIFTVWSCYLYVTHVTFV